MHDLAAQWPFPAGRSRWEPAASRVESSATPLTPRHPMQGLPMFSNSPVCCGRNRRIRRPPIRAVATLSENRCRSMETRWSSARPAKMAPRREWTGTRRATRHRERARPMFSPAASGSGGRLDTSRHRTPRRATRSAGWWRFRAARWSPEPRASRAVPVG